MIEQIRKRTFKAHPHPLREMESLGQPRGDGGGARTLQDSHTAISHRASRNRIEGAEIEHASGCGIRDIAIAGTVWAGVRKSLGMAQDFLTAIWLCWSSEQGQFGGSYSLKRWK